ncbi:hypothetical protein CRG98_012207, partial [Punica granatum]
DPPVFHGLRPSNYTAFHGLRPSNFTAFHGLRPSNFTAFHGPWPCTCCRAGLDPSSAFHNVRFLIRWLPYDRAPGARSTDKQTAPQNGPTGTQGPPKSGNKLQMTLRNSTRFPEGRFSGHERLPASLRGTSMKNKDHNDPRAQQRSPSTSRHLGNTEKIPVTRAPLARASQTPSASDDQARIAVLEGTVNQMATSMAELLALLKGSNRASSSSMPPPGPGPTADPTPVGSTNSSPGEHGGARNTNTAHAGDARPDSRYGDCSLFPGMRLPPKFKIPEFKTYEGTTDPRHHLRHYQGKMLSYWEYEEFVVHSFQDSLSGSTLDWFMSLKAEDIPTWEDLSRRFTDQYRYCAETPPTILEMSTKEMVRGQKFEEYAAKWRAQAAKHIPPISEAQQIQLFHSTLREVYYSHLLAHTSSFSDLIEAGKKLDLGIKLGRMEDPTSKGEESSKKASAAPSSSGGRRTKEVSASQPRPPVSRAPPPAQQNPTPQGQQIQPVSPGPNFDPSVQYQSKHYEYHQGAPGHTLDNCWRLRDEIKRRIDSNRFTFNAVRPPNVQANPLPDHRPSSGPSINMISICISERDEEAQENSPPFVINYTLEELTVGFTGHVASSAPFVFDIPAREPYSDSKVPWTYEGSVGSVEQQFSVMGVTRSGRVVGDNENLPFHSFETISVIRDYGESGPSRTDRMIGKVLLRNNHIPGTGLGVRGQGISRPIEIEELHSNPNPRCFDSNLSREQLGEPQPVYFGEGLPEDSQVPEMEESLRRLEDHQITSVEPTEEINVGTEEEPRTLKIGTALDPTQRARMIDFLKKYQEVFAWSYADMPGLDPSIIEHFLPLDTEKFPPKRQQLRRQRASLLLRIKEEVVKQINAGFLEVCNYSEWVANIVPVKKKDGRVRVCVDYRDLNKASPKDNFPLPHIDEDKLKTTFTTMWGTFCYRVMAFGLKNAGATYQRAMVTLFHDMMHKEVEVYVDDMIAKSKEEEDHLINLKRLLDRLKEYKLRLNPAKCTFGARSGKLPGFVDSERGIEVDPDKVKAIKELPPPSTVREVRGFLGRLNYIARFIANLTDKCQPLFRLLRKNAAMEWDHESKVDFSCTNNVAEYEACILGLQAAIDFKVKELEVFGDSMLTIFQTLGQWKTKDAKLVPYQEYLEGLAKNFKKISFTDTPRAKNQFADALATLASMPWYEDIKNFLQTGQYPPFADRRDRKTLRRLAMHYFLGGEILYRRSFDSTLLRCIDEHESRRLMEEVYLVFFGSIPVSFGFVLVLISSATSRHVQTRYVQQRGGDGVRTVAGPKKGDAYYGATETPGGIFSLTDSRLPHVTGCALNAPETVEGCTTLPKPRMLKEGRAIRDHHQSPRMKRSRSERQTSRITQRFAQTPVLNSCSGPSRF